MIKLKIVGKEEREIALKEGEAKGFSEGSYLAKLETAKNLLELGLSIENIARATGLTERELEQL